MSKSYNQEKGNDEYLAQVERNRKKYLQSKAKKSRRNTGNIDFEDWEAKKKAKCELHAYYGLSKAKRKMIDAQNNSKKLTRWIK